MALITLAQLRLAAQQRADMENSGFLSEAEWNRNINSSARELYDLLVSVFEDYYETEFPFTTVANQDTYSLPADFYKLLGADQVLGSGRSSTLFPYDALKRNAYQSYANSGDNIVLRYVPTMPPLASDSDTFDGINGWEEYIIVDAAKKASGKEESDVNVALLASEKADLKARILSMAPNRDAGFGDYVNDVNDFINNPWNVTAPQYAYRLGQGRIRLVVQTWVGVAS